MDGALNGITVVEIGHYIAGPHCAQLFADMGANVIKVERPGGEAARGFGPYVQEESLYYTSYNRNKRSIEINFKSEEGLAAFRKLTEIADIIIDNQRPGYLSKLGFSFEAISQYNPGIIMTVITGYGQEGPMRNLPALDMVMQGVGGLMSITGFPDGPPTRAGVAVTDFFASLYGALGAMMALHARSRTGKGQVVDIAMLDTLFSALEQWPAATKMLNWVPAQAGNGRMVTAPSNAYPTKNGWVYISAVANAHFGFLCKEMGHPELIDDPEYATSGSRKKACQRLDATIAEWTKQQTNEEVCERLDKLGVAVGPVNSIPELVDHEQIKIRGMMLEMPHPTLGKLSIVGNPMKLSANPPQYLTPPPAAGQHTKEILKELGLPFD